MRALGSFGGSSFFGHGSDCPSVVQVRFRSPARPWIKQISAVAFSQSCHTSTPSGKVGGARDLSALLVDLILAEEKTEGKKDRESREVSVKPLVTVSCEALSESGDAKSYGACFDCREERHFRRDTIVSQRHHG